MIEIKYSELYKQLRQSGCIITREGSNHSLWYSPKTGKTFPVGRHKAQDVPEGTLRSIKKSAGLE